MVRTASRRRLKDQRNASNSAGAWRLVWADEFDGEHLDPTKWDCDLGNGFYDYRTHAWVAGWGNEELQYYTREPANLFLRDGCLHLRAIKESLHGCGYTSARVRTCTRDGRTLFAKRYGRFEFRARVPHGRGLWPAIWMLPVEEAYGGWAASGEIDVMEIVATKPHEVLGSIHFGSTFPKRELVTHVHRLPGRGTVADWHVYAVEWEPGEIRWEVDGAIWATQSFWWSCSRLRGGRGVTAARAADLNPWPAPFDREFYLLMNVAVGGNFPGNPPPTTAFPAELVVDYVRVYDRVGGYGEPKPRGRGRFPWHPRRVEKRG